MVEALEEFEHEVEARGGDLMVDEPPSPNTAQPDDWHFLLPVRSRSESATKFIGRLREATTAVREHRPHSP
jgi:hypothetical protein